MRFFVILLLALPAIAQPFSQSDPVFSQVLSPLLQGCVGAWRLEEASGTRYDMSSYNNHLTSNNSVGQQAGKVGNCATFVKTSSQSLTGTTTNQLQFTNTQPMTVVAWVKLTNSPVITQGIISKYNATTGRGYFLYASDSGGKPALYMGSSGSGVFYRIGTTVLTNAAWHFVAATYTGSNTTNGITLYVDNASETITGGNQSGTRDGVNNIGTFTIGFSGIVANDYANGLIDEPTVWNRVLTTAELGYLYFIGLGTHTPWAHP